jgi:hypothetical protein
MPRPRKEIASPSLSPGQAKYVLDRLVSERRVSPGEINRYVNEMHGEISSLEQQLERLRAAVGGSGAAAPVRRGRPAGSGRPPGRPPGPGRPGRRPGRPSAASADAAGSESARSGKARRGGRGRTAITPEQLASRQLQGRYLGLIRQIPGNKRAPYQRTAKEKGREAAIREMMDTLKK